MEAGAQEDGVDEHVEGEQLNTTLAEYGNTESTSEDTTTPITTLGPSKYLHTTTYLQLKALLHAIKQHYRYDRLLPCHSSLMCYVRFPIREPCLTSVAT